MKSPTPVSELILQRTSRRTYRPEPLSEADSETITRNINELRTGPLGTPMKFSLISMQEASTQKLRLGTYGFIQGAQHFIAGQIQPSGIGFLDYGFIMEKLILELTRAGLGTCWLGGTFDRGEFARAIGLKEGNVIPAITPVGYATEVRGFGDRLIRFGAGSKKRLPSEQLFHDLQPGAPLNPEKGDPLHTILESVRFAPSASNNQPWRIVRNGDLYHFHISRKPGYRKAFSKVDMQMIDMGIAMQHFDAVARETGCRPGWKISEGEPSFEGWEYVISVLLHE